MSIAKLSVPATTDEAQILAVVETLLRPQLIRDAELFAAQFAPDAALVNLARPQVDDAFNSTKKERWETPVHIEPRDVSIKVSGDVAYCHCNLQMCGKKRGADGTVRFWIRETLCFEREAGEWRIVHEHTSPPYYPLAPELVNKVSDLASPETIGQRASKLIELRPNPRALAAEHISKIAIKSNGKILFIDSCSLMSVEAKGGYILLEEESGSTHLLRESISKTEEKLKTCGFVRIHRSVLVNPAFVRQIRPMGITGEYELQLKNGREFTVTRTFKKNLATLAALWIGTGNLV